MNLPKVSKAFICTNIVLFVIPFVFSLCLKTDPLLPGDTGSYVDYFKSSDNSYRTAGYPLLLTLSKFFSANIIFNGIIANIISSLLAALLFWLHSFIFTIVTGRFIAFRTRTRRYFLLALSCPAVFFLLFLPLSDYSFIILSSAIYVMIFDLYNSFDLPGNTLRLLRPYCFLYSFFLGLVYGLISLIRPVGTFVPFFLLLCFALFFVVSLVCHRRSSDASTSTAPTRIWSSIIYLFLPLVIGSSIILSTYSIYHFHRFGSYNYLRIASLNANCYRSTFASSMSPENSFEFRQRCIDYQSSTTKSYSSNLARLQSNNFRQSLLSMLKFPMALLRGIFDSDYISFLRLLGFYSDPSFSAPASIDYLYTFRFHSLLQQFNSRIRPTTFTPTFYLLVLSSCIFNSLFFVFALRVAISLKYRMAIYPTTFFLSIYFLLTSTGPDAAGRYFAPLLFIQFLPML